MIGEYINKLGKLEMELIKALDKITVKKNAKDILNHYVQAKNEIISTYQDEGVRKVYDELIKYVQSYLTLLTGEEYD